jgi:CDP-paratose 2-epimerase
MSVAIVTGSAGLVGSESVRHFAALGMKVVGVDNNMRAKFFGNEASTEWMRKRLVREVPGYSHHQIDIRDQAEIFRLFEFYKRDIALVIHAAAQPSHDWAASNPFVDFSVNANGTQVVLEATRRSCPDAVFIFTSTNKVYGDAPNHLPLVEREKRWEIDSAHTFVNGIPEDMPIDRSLHSLFGASKLAADILVQEYGRYFGMRTVCFRGGCLTGPNHSGTELHGFLSYLMKCAVTGTRYRVLGYKGKQVRDNIHSADLVKAFEHFFRQPRTGEVYNIGGGRFSNCSVLEAIDLCQEVTGREMSWEYLTDCRTGDHVWYISDLSRFKNHYPGWSIRYDVPLILQEMHENNTDAWLEKQSVAGA